MITARHHAEWLSLVETSGPFLSMPVLTRVFPQGLDPRDAERSSRLREAYEEWLDSGQKPAMHHAWIRHVLSGFLGYEAQFLAEGQAIPAGIEASMANYGETLRPDFVLKRPGADEKPVLLIEMHPAEQDLNKPVPARVWKASPATRMMELLHATNIPVGLVTNGEQWMLVFAPRGETTGFASWYADLWMQEPITLRAFNSLLQQRRFLGVADGETLPALLAESSNDQQEVTDQLGLQVRHAVEMLVRALDRLDEESGRQLLREVSEKDLYNGALTVMMRLVFLFSAEERGLLLLGDPLYDQHYAVSTLSQLLRERADQHGEEVLERRQDAWCRLLSTFRGVHGGIEHEALRLPPYGGTLFDPDRFPFLEGRVSGTSWRVAPAKPLAINNRVVLHLLESLQVLRVKVPGGGPAETRRLSFRALDIEQIGHVYEGLLDHTAKRASEVMLGLAGGKGREPEIALLRLEELAGFSGADLLEPEFSSSEPHLLAAEAPGTVLPMPRATGSATYQPDVKLVEFLKEETGRSEKALIKALTEPAKIEQNRLFLACGRDRVLFDRVSRFAGLLRSDDFDQPVVVRGGSVFVTSGSDRRSTGTHYTPRSLTEPIVQHTLEPLVYSGPADGTPKADWKLKTPREILSLKVCDMAMGSGAFLVQTCRYLAERLVEAWENAERANPGKILATPEGDFSSGDPKERLIPADPAERLSIARRYVADRCLYGVDINPMAVEMAKLSLWLITLQRDRPFTFLDHALKCGDSLLGTSQLSQIEVFSYREGHHLVNPAVKQIIGLVQGASEKRGELKALPSNDHTQIETKNRLHAAAEAAIAKVKTLADCLVALELRGLDGDAYANARETEADHVQSLLKHDADAALKSPISNQQSALAAYANKQLCGRRPFHWPVEFPEVFARGGFDAFVGNPPFIGNRLWKTSIGVHFTQVAKMILGEPSGKIDVCVVFHRQAANLLKASGHFGLLAATNIAEGSAIQVGLGKIIKQGRIYFSRKGMPWPGQAAVVVAIVCFSKGSGWLGSCDADGVICARIGSRLQFETEDFAAPNALVNSMFSFEGVNNSKGLAFVVTESNSWHIRLLSERNSLLRRYVTGDDINTSALNCVDRWALDLADRSLASIAESWPIAHQFLVDEVKQSRTPDVLTSYLGLHERWWQFWCHRADPMRRLRRQSHFIAYSKVTKYPICMLAPSDWIYTNQVLLIALEREDYLAICLSSYFQYWLEVYCGGGLGETLRLSITESATKFPLCENQASAAAIRAAAKFNVDAIEWCKKNCCGLTELMNRIHSPDKIDVQIMRFRELLATIDTEVAAAYGWSDLVLGHGFHATKQGERFTISESARRTVLDRLLALNHQRYAEEVAAGLHEKGAKKNKGRKAKVSESDLNTSTSRPQMDLL